MEDLAIGVTHHWDDSWEADTGDNIRKIAVVNSCREIMRGFELFAQIIEMKIGKEKEDDNSNSEAEDVQLFKNDQPYEIKEESMEIKEEPIDDFSDLKLEEPIADIFCPSTGSSRPIDAPIHPSVEVNTRECGNAKDPAIGKKINSTGNYRIVNQLKANSREVLRTERVEGTKRSSEKKEINRSAGPRKELGKCVNRLCICAVHLTDRFIHRQQERTSAIRAIRTVNTPQSQFRGKQLKGSGVMNRRLGELRDKKNPIDYGSHGKEETIEEEEPIDKSGPSRKW